MEKVDKGIPVPADKRSWNSKYPWDECEVGDSFKIHALSLNSANHSCWERNKKNNGEKTFRSAKHEDHIRVWRIK